jgi:amino acid permease
VLLEIQDTLKQPPRASATMGKAVHVAVTSAFGFYISSAVACYSALGDDVPGEVLQGFPRECSSSSCS